MTNGLVFILHGPAEAGFAADLAAALSPLVAMPMLITADRQTSYGSAATCVVALDHDLAARPLSVALSAPINNTIICRGAGVALPAQLAGYASVDAQPTLAASVAVLADAIARKQSQAAENASRSRRTSPSLAKRGAEVRETNKHSLAVRTAWGLAATVAVASIAAPAIGGRAGASSVSVEPEALAPQANVVQVAATVAPQAAEEPELAPVETPQLIQLLDRYDRNERAEAAPTIAYAPEAPAVVVEPSTSFGAVAVVSLSADSNAALVVASAGSPKQASAPTLPAESMQAQQQPATVALKPSA